MLAGFSTVRLFLSSPFPYSAPWKEAPTRSLLRYGQCYSSLFTEAVNGGWGGGVGGGVGVAGLMTEDPKVGWEGDQEPGASRTG